MNKGVVESMEKERRWNELPDVALRKIFGELRIIDRARMRLVCKSWKQFLTRVDLPLREIPWEFQSQGSCFDSETDRLTEIQFQSFSEQGANDKKYSSELPKFHRDDDTNGGWLCGCSDGWLVIAAGPRTDPHIFLWNPLTSTTLRLPPLSTLDFIKSFDISKQYNISNYVKRVQVFMPECVVAVVFADPADEEDGAQFMVLSTPQDKSWTIFEGDSRAYYLFDDILYHDNKLYVLGEEYLKDDCDEDEGEGEYTDNFVVGLSNCQVQVCLLGIKFIRVSEAQDKYTEEKVENPLFNITWCDHAYKRLGEYLGQLITILITYDRYTFNSSNACPIKACQYLQIRRVVLKKVDGGERILSLGGNRSMLLADNGLVTISGLATADRIFYGITSDHAGGFIADKGCVVRETGNVRLRDGRITRNTMEFLKYPAKCISCYLTPKLI